MSRNATSMTPAELDELLAEVRTVAVASLNRDGSAHLVAMWFGHDDSAIVFSTFARSQKALNFQRDPRITVMAESGDRPDELRGATWYGTATMNGDPDAVTAYCASAMRKYLGIEPTEEQIRSMAAKRVLFTVDASRVVSWDHRKLARSE